MVKQIGIYRSDYLSLRGAEGDVAIPKIEGKTIEKRPETSGDCHTSGAPRSESKIGMIAGGNHTLIKCGLVRNDSKINENLKL